MSIIFEKGLYMLKLELIEDELGFNSVILSNNNTLDTIEEVTEEYTDAKTLYDSIVSMLTLNGYEPTNI